MVAVEYDGIGLAQRSATRCAGTARNGRRLHEIGWDLMSIVADDGRRRPSGYAEADRV